MAENQNKVNSILIIRNDLTTAWESSTYKLKRGELALEYVYVNGVATGKVKMKAGAENSDKTWAELPYIGGDESQVYQSEILPTTNADTDDTIINGLVGEGVTPNKGDIAIIKRAIVDAAEGETPDKVSHTAYVYDGENWAAMDGNYSADNVFTSKKMVLAGSYANGVGNYAKGKEIEAGTSLQSLLSGMFSQRIQPGSTNPSAAIYFTNKNTNGQNDEVEIGTTYTAKYRTTFTDGKFQPSGGSAQNAGCSSTAATITFAGKTKSIAANALNGASGSMDSVIITDTSKKTLTLTYGWTANTVTPVDNLGDPATNGAKIDAASGKTATSSHGVTGFRYAFGGSSTSTIAATSANIRSLKSKTKSSNSSFSVTIDEGAKCVMIAVPDGRKITAVADEGAFGTDIYSEDLFPMTTATVGGADATADSIGNYSMTYNIYTYSPSTALGANTYTVTIANE